MTKTEYKAWLCHSESLSHSGVKGMKWGYDHGTRNGKRTAVGEDEPEISEEGVEEEVEDAIREVSDEIDYDKKLEEIDWESEEGRKYFEKALADAQKDIPGYDIKVATLTRYRFGANEKSKEESWGVTEFLNGWAMDSDGIKSREYQTEADALRYAYCIAKNAVFINKVSKKITNALQPLADQTVNARTGKVTPSALQVISTIMPRNFKKIEPEYLPPQSILSAANSKPLITKNMSASEIAGLIKDWVEQYEKALNREKRPNPKHPNNNVKGNEGKF